MPLSDEAGALMTGARIRGCALLCLVLLFYGCGSSGPTQTESAPTEIAEVAVEVEAAPRQSRSERRRSRREREASIEEGDDSLEAIPAAATQAYDRALAAMLSGDDTEAELELEQFILEFPNYPGPYVNLAILHRGNGRTADAQEALDRALALEPGHAAANNQLGILHRAEGRFVEAEEAYLRAIEANPEYALAYYNLGVLLDLYLKRPAAALENYERYQELQAEPNEMVGRWIIDLSRRVGVTNSTAHVTQEDAS